MRKDVKVGLASGAVLLAVIIVYFSTLNKTPTTAKPGARLTIASGPAASSGGTDHGSISIAMGDGGSSAAASGGASSSGEADWAKLLGEGAPPSLMTHTPVGEPAETNTEHPAAGGDVFASNTGTGASTSAASPSTSGGSTAAGLAGSVSHPAPTPKATSTESTSATHTYVVKENQSFSTIAAELYGSAHFYPHLMRANPGLDPRQLRPGMTINVPDVSAVKPSESSAATAGAHESTAVAPAPAVAKGEYRVESNDSLYKIAMKVYGSPKQVDAIYQLNKSTIGDDPARLKVGTVLKMPAK
jgi:nucleoid-associated protein YgaU